MRSIYSLAFYICFGFIGGICGLKMKIPGGVMMGALLAVIFAKIVFKIDVEIPKSFTFIFQIFLGVIVGSSFQPEMFKIFGKIAVPVITSTLILVGGGVVLSFILARLNILDIGTAYLGTSPGAMSAIIILALDSDSNSMVVTCFHFFRVVFIIVTTPFIFKFFLD